MTHSGGDSPVVKLTPAEILQGATVGVMRQTQNIKLKRKRAYGCDEDRDWQWHVEGALGEMAFAKYMGCYWTGAFSFRCPDVGSWQVRTRLKDYYDLIVHEDDADDDRFVLLTGRNGTYTIRGWMLGRDAKQQRWWADPAKNRPAFFVPQSELVFFDAGVAQLLYD